MSNNLRSLSIALLGGLALSAGGTVPAPVPVTFGPNIDLSMQNDSPGVIQRETTIAVNPKNPLNIVEGNHFRGGAPTAAHDTFSFSMDGGRSWTLGGAVPLEQSPGASGDPALAADADGNFYFSHIDFSTTVQGYILSSSVVVAKSTDGGRSFPTLSVVHEEVSTPVSDSSPDKDYIGIDTWGGSPFKGTIYVGWTETIANVSGVFYQIQVAVSRDQGQTWSSPIGVSQLAPAFTEGLFGALPVAAPDGTVYVFYADMVFNTGPTSIRFSKSTDGGKTWSKPADVASGLPSPGFFRLKNDDPNWDTTFPLGILSNSLPTAAIAPDGTISVAWADFPNGSCTNDGSFDPPCTNSDVRLSISKNSGTTWSTPTKVSDETNATDQFMPWIAAHPDGLLSLAWTDKRLDPNNANYDVFYTNTHDGATFLPNVRVSSTTSISGNEQTQIQDYNGLAVSADAIFPVWGQMTSNTPDVFTAVGHFVK